MATLTRLGLRTLGQLAASPKLDQLRLRRPLEKVLYHGTKAGFKSATAASRAFKAIKGLSAPQRLGRAPASDLFDLRPTDDQAMLQEAARSFALERFRPDATAADAACAAPDHLLAEGTELGVTALGIPESLGGMGTERSAMTNLLITQALAEGDMGLAFATLAPSAVSTALVLWGTAEQQAAYLPAFTGETPPAAALAVLEPAALFDPFEPKASARRSGSGWVLEGLKSMVPLAGRAELFVVAAQADGLGPALFIVESSTAGLSVESDPSMGLRAAGCARLRLAGVQLPAGAVLASGDDYAQCIHLSRLAWCAMGTGCAQAVLDYVTGYVNEREAFGEPISHRQSVAFAVADTAIELHGMRLLAWRAASLADAGQPYAQATALARRLCAEHSARIGSTGVQLLGGHGFVKDHPVERWYRDLRAVGVMEGGLLV